MNPRVAILVVFTSAICKLVEGQHCDNDNFDGVCPPDCVGNIVNPENCSTFLSCGPGVGKDPRDCQPPGATLLCYDPDLDRCDWCDQVPRCSPTSPPKDDETTTTIPPKDDDTTTTIPTTTTTAKSTTRKEGATTSQRTTTPRHEEETDCTRLVNGKFPMFQVHPYDCSRFFMCKRDGSFGDKGYCAEGLWFNFKDQACREPWANHCKFFKTEELEN